MLYVFIVNLKQQMESEIGVLLESFTDVRYPFLYQNFYLIHKFSPNYFFFPHTDMISGFLANIR